MSSMKYIGALDVGTTTVRFHILDQEGYTVASSAEKVRYLRMCPLQFFNSLRELLNVEVGGS